jgi:hypothetical protein
MTTGEESKGSDIQRAGNHRGDGVQLSVLMRIMLVTGVRPNELSGDLEAGEGAHATGTQTREQLWPLMMSSDFLWAPSLLQCVGRNGLFPKPLIIPILQ